jgi:hypothetical protein
VVGHQEYIPEPLDNDSRYLADVDAAGAGGNESDDSLALEAEEGVAGWDRR